MTLILEFMFFFVGPKKSYQQLMGEYGDSPSQCTAHCQAIEIFRSNKTLSGCTLRSVATCIPAKKKLQQSGKGTRKIQQNGHLSLAFTMMSLGAHV